MYQSPRALFTDSSLLGTSAGSILDHVLKPMMHEYILDWPSCHTPNLESEPCSL